MEHVGERFRAQTGDVNLRSRNAGRFELIAIGARQIEVRAIAGAASKPPRDGICRMSRVSKRRDDFGPHFAAARTQAGADGGDQIFGIRTKRFLHCAHCRRCRATNGSPPARVRGADDATAAICEQDRRAIGNANARSAGWIVRHGYVGLRARPWQGPPTPRNRDRRPMYLADEQHPIVTDANFARHRVPFVAVVTKLEAGGREKMIGIRQQRPAAQHRSPGGLRPFKTIARLRQSHEYPRTRIRCDRHSPDCRHL